MKTKITKLRVAYWVTVFVLGQTFYAMFYISKIVDFGHVDHGFRFFEHGPIYEVSDIWLWGIVLMLMALPIMGDVRDQVGGGYRKKHGLCERCGYDLRASADRCPECGTPVH